MNSLLKRIFIIFLLQVSFASSLLAGGPKKIAKINRSLWPYQINSVYEFDFASRMEMLVLINVLDDQDKCNHIDSLKKYLGLEKVAIESVNKWKEQTKEILQTNFKSLTPAGKHDFVVIPTPISWMGLVNSSKQQEKAMPDNLKAWYTEAKEFYNSYVYEQMRLAALFPRTTSEILNLDTDEINGNNFGDKQFLLTFDDGPTHVNGNTDKLISTLRQNNINGVFFVLGDMFYARRKVTSDDRLKALYGKNIVGSHGKVHKSHQKYPEWKSSISFTANIIDSVIPERKKSMYFRPPYGQRTQEVINFLEQNNSKVMLWNIDSQDWNAKISSSEVADRIITLMLVWRKGILLFHDIHPKANQALPLIWKQLNKAGVTWLDPNSL
ncbi:polysaccharide deacetylase family protein [Sporocytophaga myxococcoides]|uniref:polysaccharide deacetylase family protein n=1 Tax=Sporocytophaga myxococcoides TaxID=153721 RepID=UPI00048CA863|nr:polysaccharide deacetylase family protein [Sporocytophaga myxococcoides]